MPARVEKVKTKLTFHFALDQVEHLLFLFEFFISFVEAVLVLFKILPASGKLLFVFHDFILDDAEG